MKRPKKGEEAEFLGKIRSMIDYFYPGIEEEMRKSFILKNKNALRNIKRDVDFRLWFHAWFLLKYEFPSGATAMEMADSFPLDYLTKKEKKMVKNFLSYKESLFEIIKISEDKKEYFLKDLSDNKEHNIKTIDLPPSLKEKEIIQAIIIKNMKNDYFFYGIITSFDITNRKEFVKALLKEIKHENSPREKAKIEWEIQK